MPQIPAIGLVVVCGGVAQAYTPPHVMIRIVDIDDIKAGDEATALPRGYGFSALVRAADAEEYVSYYDPEGPDAHVY